MQAELPLSMPTGGLGALSTPRGWSPPNWWSVGGAGSTWTCFSTGAKLWRGLREGAGAAPQCLPLPHWVLQRRGPWHPESMPRQFLTCSGPGVCGEGQGQGPGLCRALGSMVSRGFQTLLTFVDVAGLVHQSPPGSAPGGQG